MACQRSMTHKKEEGEKKGVAMSKKKERKEGDDTRERTNALRSKPYHHLSTHPYTCTFWLKLHDLFLHGSSLWLYNIWNASMPCFYPTLSSTKDLSTIGKTEGRCCLVRIIKVECFERIILGNLAMFSKIFFKNISRWIADLWTSKYCFANRSNSQQPKTSR